MEKINNDFDTYTKNLPPLNWCIYWIYNAKWIKTI